MNALLLLCAAITAVACEPHRPAIANAESARKTSAPRVNDLQWVGTHNSYHVAPDDAVFELMRATGYQESAEWTADRLAGALSFTHPTIEKQLDMGLRVFELDVHDDPKGGRYATPGFLRALDATVAKTLPPVDPLGELREPGMKVFHTADTDVRSRCLRFVACLESIRDWSLDHPRHLPIFIQIETKESRKPAIANAYASADPAPFDAAAWARLHAEIESVFAPEHIVRPAEVRRGYAHVNAAVRTRGWPPVETVRGRVIFLLLDDPPKQDRYVAFVEAGHEPILFVSRHAEDPETAWLIRPTPEHLEIRPLVNQGFLVYTRADAHGAEARRGDVSRTHTAFASGAQLIATDFPAEDPRYASYQVSFGGRYVRCNPVLKPRGCDVAPMPDAQPGPKNLE